MKVSGGGGEMRERQTLYSAFYFIIFFFSWLIARSPQPPLKNVLTSPASKMEWDTGFVKLLWLCTWAEPHERETALPLLPALRQLWHAGLSCVGV